MKTATKNKPANRDAAIKIVKKYLEDHFKFINDLFLDYVVHPDLRCETDAANEGLIAMIDELKTEADFTDMLEILKQLAPDQKETDETLNCLDEDYVKEFIEDKGYEVIDTDNGHLSAFTVLLQTDQQRVLVEDFIKENIYTSVNQQNAYMP
jgi:hypothetical protein